MIIANRHITLLDGVNKRQRSVETALFIGFCLLIVGCESIGQGNHCILPEGIELQTGDVVFRMGSGIESHAVRMMDVDGDYSHIGIVVDTMGRKMVVHAVPGEPDFEGDIDRVKLDEVQTFFSAVHAGKGEITRIDDELAARYAAQVALDVFRRGVPFDHDYDSNDTTRMYCTELVKYVYQCVGLRLVTSPPHEVELPLLHVEVYYPSDVYHSRHLRSVVKF